MSWQDILDIGLLQSGKIVQAAIVGQDGEVWAESPGSNGPAREIVLGGRRYATTMGCLDMILAKRTAGREGGGCVVKKTDQSVIIAEYVSASTADSMIALALVERLADYLISKGY